MKKSRLTDHCTCECFAKFDNQGKDIIRLYQHWVLYLNFNQGFVGRSLVILKKHKKDITEITDEENSELLLVIKKFKLALGKIVSLYNLNIVISNTESHIHNNHLHIHLIPRYDKPVKIGNAIFPHDSEVDKRVFYNKLNRDIILGGIIRENILSKLRKLLS
ncbi:MAG: HIT domain-containing protein [Candidatus Paceibacterota bacterium]|jgi:diadenosine tetraphosphate (Ap4A) HIT family hydrolase